MKKRILPFVLAIVLIFSLTPTAFATSNPWAENDLPSDWAESYVRDAYSHNLIPENLMSRFYRSITRAEFAALGVRLYEEATGREITGRADFVDTDDENVRKMGYLGVVQGVGGGRFDPNGELRREQAATMLSRLATAVGLTLSGHEATFYDNNLISYWAMDHVGQMQVSGIMGGVGGNRFEPNGRYTIEQSVTTILRVFNMHFVHNIPEYIIIQHAQIPTSTTLLNFYGRGNRVSWTCPETGHWSGQINLRRLTNADIQPLRYMVNLTDLQIATSDISDITPLARLTNLTELILWDNQISDIAPLAGLRNLDLLELGNNQITDLAPLTGLTNLRELHLGYNQISDLSPLAGLTNLVWLTLPSNPITDWSPVSHVPNVSGRP